MFFIYMTYTLLALHVEECTVSGLLLGFTQACLFVCLLVCLFVSLFVRICGYLLVSLFACLLVCSGVIYDVLFVRPCGDVDRFKVILVYLKR